MRPIRETCVPRSEVLQGDLDDAIFAADFGHVIEGRAPRVYQDPENFFRNTYPTDRLKKIVTTIFDRLANPSEAGAVLRLSTGFGGGKTHTLIALWHLAKHITQPTLGTELLPAAGRPKQVVVAAMDASKFGRPICATHDGVAISSLHGELAWQLGGAAAYARVRAIDHPNQHPDAATIRALLPDAPLLILIDELVIYMSALNEEERGNLLAFINLLLAEVGARRQAMVVITDPAGQAVYARQADALAGTLDPHAAQALDEVLGRRASDEDIIGAQSAQVVNRRLFEEIDASAAEEASAEYYHAYQRMREQFPDPLPAEAGTKDYATRIQACYPFHPRLLDTAQSRLGALQDFNQSRGVLRLFARILRDIWERQLDVTLISAGEINWQSERIQADLLHRLNRDNFRAAVEADVLKHAKQLDADFQTDIHRRVAAALLLESLPMNENAALSKRDLGLAVLRPSDVGHEAADAVDRLFGICWHLYKDDSGLRFQFRYEPNANRLIEERAGTIPLADARQRVLALAQSHFSGHVFPLVAYPGSPKAVADSAKLQLVLCDSEALAHRVCNYEDDSDPEAKRPRCFRNAIFAIAPNAAGLERAVEDMRRLIAAEQVAKDQRKGTPLRTQVDELLPQLRRSAHIATLRAFDRVVLPGRPSALPLEEKYLVPAEGALNGIHGQTRLKDFLDDKRLIYQPGEALDVELLLQLLRGATPSVEHVGAYPASALHERALSSNDKLRLMLDDEPVRRSILNAVEQDRLVVRLADGTVYDAEGCISGAPGRRQRVPGQRLSTLKLSADVLLAEPTAECVKAWRHTDDALTPGELITIAEAAKRKGTSSEEMSEAVDLGEVDYVLRDGERLVVVNERFAAWEPGPSDNGEVRAYDWDTAIDYAAKRALRQLTLTARSPAALERLLACAQPLGAQRLFVTLLVEGAFKEGGSLRFVVEQVRHDAPIKPLDMARKLLNVVSENAMLKADLELDFGGETVPNAEERLRRARERAGDITIEALFGAEGTV